ncbi:Uncharacterised protein [uncultured archaeon]|nr:Uncharacterised protein [uncultured archaeon]
MDSNGDSTWNTGEPNVVVVLSGGGGGLTYDVTLTVPTVTTGNYNIREGAKSKSFAVTQMTLNPTSGPSGTVVTVSGSNFPSGNQRVYFDSNGNNQWDSGEPYQTVNPSGGTFSTTITVPLVSDGLYGIRIGKNSPYTAIDSATFTVVTQYQVTFKETGISSDAGTNIVLKVDVGNDGSWNYNYIYNDLTSSGTSITVASGTQIKYEYQTPVATSDAGKQYVWDTTTGTGSFTPAPLGRTGTYTIIAASTLTGGYNTQWYITVNANGHGSPTQASQWVNDNAPFSVSVTSPEVVVADEHRWLLTGLTIDSVAQDPVVNIVSYDHVLGSHAIVFSWTEQWYITFTQFGVSTDFIGTVVKIDGINYAVTDLPKSFWWNDDSSHSFAYQSPLAVGMNKKYIWDTTSGLSNVQSNALFKVTQSGSITGNYHYILLTYTVAASGQYSDPVAVSATLLDSITGAIAGKSITFNIGTQSVSATTDSTGLASATIVLNQPAGIYTTKAIYVGPSVSTSLFVSQSFTIIVEDIKFIEYSGDTIVPITESSINLKATVGESQDGSLGNLALIKVTFTIRDSTTDAIVKTYSGVAVGVVDPGIGVAKMIIPRTDLPEGGYYVIVSIDSNNYYTTLTTSDPVPLEIYTPTGSFVTGGGYILNKDGNKCNFGFNAKYQILKKGTKLQGHLTYINRVNKLDYMVKSTSVTGLGFDSKETTHAYFEGQCQVRIYNPATGEFEWSNGGYQYRVDVWDKDTSGIGADIFQLLIRDKNGATWLKTGFDPLGILQGGNIVIHSKD